MSETKHNDDDLYDAEARMSLTDALVACGADLDLSEGECTLHDSHDVPIVSYWPVINGGWEARWHRREDSGGMDGDITCGDGEAVPEAYYSRLDRRAAAGETRNTMPDKQFEDADSRACTDCEANGDHVLLCPLHAAAPDLLAAMIRLAHAAEASIGSADTDELHKYWRDPGCFGFQALEAVEDAKAKAEGSDH